MARRLLSLLLVAIVAVGGFFAREPISDAAVAVARTVGDWSTRLRDLAAGEPQTEVEQRSIAGASSSVLLTVGESEGAAAFVLLVADPSGPPVALVLPQDLLVAVPGFGEFRLVDAMVFGGPDLVALAITNQFGIRIDAVAGVPTGAVAGGLLGPVEVDLSVALFVEGPGGLSRVLPAGRTQVAPALVEELMVNAGAGDQFEWIQRQGSAWRAVLDAISAAPPVADRITALGGPSSGRAADLLVTVAGDGAALLATIPVTRAESSTGIEALVPAAEQADDFIRTRFDHLLLRPEGRPRVEVLNGNGRIGTTAGITAILVRSGFRVVRADNADAFDYQQTLIVAQGQHAEGWAREILDLVGQGLLFLEVRAPSGVVDVSIIVGEDIPAGQG